MFPDVVALFDSNFQAEQTERTGVAVELPCDLYELLAADPASDFCTVSDLAAKIIREHYAGIQTRRNYSCADLDEMR